MPGKILGLDIHNHSLTAVQVTSGLKGYQITACAHILFKEGQELEQALSELRRELDLKSDLCITAIPAEDLSIRNFTLPFRDTKKIRQILPYELEPRVPFPLNELIIDYQVAPREKQSEILAISAGKETIADYLSRLQKSEIDPDVIEAQPAPMLSWLISQSGTPEDGLLLYLGSSRSTMSLYLNRKFALMRTFGHEAGHKLSSDGLDIEPSPGRLNPEQIEGRTRELCREINQTLHACQWQQNLITRPQKVFFTGPGALYAGMPELLTRFLGLPAEQVNISRDHRIGMDAAISRVWNPALMDTALALALRNGRKGARFNFRKDEFEIQKPYLGIRKELRWLGLLLFLVLAFLIADLAVDYYYLKKQYQSLRARVEEVYREALPNEPYTADAVARIEKRIKELSSGSEAVPGLQAGGRVLDLMLDISGRIPQGIDLLFTRMIFDQETIRLSGTTDNFKSVDNIKSWLEPSPYFKEVTISSANLGKGGQLVNFELRLHRAE